MDDIVLRDQNLILQRIARGAPLGEVLNMLTISCEEVLPGVLCSVLLLRDGRLFHGAAPSLDEEYARAIDGLVIGPGEGSCGTAAYTGERVIVDDVLEHPHWKNYRDFATAAGLRACWSDPIASSRKEILGTFAMYYREPRTPSDGDLRLIESFSHLAGIAIERAKTDAELVRHREQLEDQVAKRTLALRVTADQLRLSVQARERMLAVVSHDLRNPLGVVHMQAQLLCRDGNGVHVASRSAEIILRSVERMNRLICDLLDFAKAEAGQLSVEPRVQEVTSLLNEAVDAHEGLAHAKDITLVAENRVPPRILVACDRNRIMQVLSNLIGNALKFVPEAGTIAIRAELRDGRVLFSVADNGRGIAAELLTSIFEPYRQAQETARLGLGLGLFIAKAIISAHGEHIWAESTEGHGATFFFSLPIATASTMERRSPAPP
jgi:signal transduction histidine kinase